MSMHFLLLSKYSTGLECTANAPINSIIYHIHSFLFPFYIQNVYTFQNLELESFSEYNQVNQVGTEKLY